MRKKKVSGEAEAREVQQWFKQHVTCEGEAYTIDAEQAMAVADTSRNVIVVARAGSGKTRTIVAKMVYLIAKCGVRADGVMAFVFNANAAAEINARLMKMCVDGVPVVGEMKKVRIATTFHAFARRIVYDACGGKDRCGRILAGEKDRFVLGVVGRMLMEPKWNALAWRFVRGKPRRDNEKFEELTDEEVVYLAQRLTQFINRAQQKFLAGEDTLREAVEARLAEKETASRERTFVQLGMECFRRYHWYLLEEKLEGFSEYGTDFNLIMSWASKLIASGREKARGILSGKQYILIDEYQDFSQLFLAMVLAIRQVVPEVKLFVVGDDWQAINRFAGSDVEYFKEFERFFPEGAQRLEITTNYRCGREVVDVARKFMMKAMGEKGNFRAFSRRAGKVVLAEPRETEVKCAVVDYDKRVGARDRVYTEAAQRMVGKMPKVSTVRYLKTLAEILGAERKAGEILFLHRNNIMNMEDVSLARLSNALKWACEKLGVMDEAKYDEKVWTMTMHKSKGLEAEVVVILEADEGVIPKTHPDTELFAVFGESSKVALDDQKRLFYVAMTRAKRRLYIIHDPAHGEGFIKYMGRGLEKWGE